MNIITAPSGFAEEALTVDSEDGAWALACPDWEQRMRAGRSLVPDLPLFADQAARGLRAFGNLRVPDIAGMPFQRDVCAPWFQDIVAALFGSLDPVSRRRMISEIFLLIPKKNAKSSNGGALMLTVVIMDEQPNQEYFLIAPTIQIAGIAFKQACDTIGADPTLKELLKPRHHLRQIQNLKTNTTLSIRAADTEVITGGKQKGTLIDESHEFCRKPKVADLYTEIRGAMATRRDGFLIQLTTQSKDAPSPQFRLELEKARAVRDGRLTYPMLPVLYEFPDAMLESEAWRDDRNWGMVNPNIGRSVDRAFLKREFAQAERAGREHLLLFASQHLNIEIGLRLKSDGWAGAAHWTRGVEPALTLQDVLDRCEVCVVGVDGGGLDDLYGLCVLGREKETRRWLTWCHALISPEGMDRRKINEAEYNEFISDGDLTLVDGLPDDVQYIVDVVETVKEAGLLAEVGVDPAGYGGLVEALAAIDVTEDNGLLKGVPQGIRLMNAAKTIERKLVDGTFKHGGTRLMNWCVSNAKVRHTSTAMMIERAASGAGKIDPLMALLNAAALMALNPQLESQGSYLDSMEMVVV